MSILTYLFMFTGIVFLLQGVFGLVGTSTPRVKLLREREFVKKPKIPLFISSFAQRVLEKFNLETKIRSRLAVGHLKISAAEFFSLKLLSMFILGILSFFAFGKFNPAILLIVVVLGYIIPDLYLIKRISRRKYMIERILPETVDLLGLCIEAGLDFIAALRWVVEKIPSNPMLEELALVLEEMKWGKSRTQALKDMAKRLNIPGVRLFVRSLVQAERMGTAIGETFAILSEDMRLERFRRGERIAMQAPIKILMPLIFCILPVIGIIIGGPIFLQFMQGGLLTGIGR